MGIEFEGPTIRKIGVVGSGAIGPDIALHFTKIFHRRDVPVVVVDIDPDALERGQAKLRRKVDRGVESGAFEPAMGEAMVANVTFTTEYAELADSGLLIEAATENLEVKGRIFQTLESLCPPDAVLASNSSHLEPERIFETLERRDRALVIHYFFPAERNPLVEIVPGADTDWGLVERLTAFYESIGKVPIVVGSRYGYAVDPVFEGLFLAAALCVEEGLGSTKEVDAVACRALGLQVGPFTAMNLTGGNPLTDHGLDEMHERLGPWFHSPALLKERIASGEPWEVPDRGEIVEVPREREEPIAAALRGAFFGLTGEIIDSGIISPSDLETAIEVGLDMTPPLRMMNETGVSRARSLVEAYAAGHDGFTVPKCLIAQAASGRPWHVDFVYRRDVDGVAVVTIRRPRVLNALNEEVYAQLRRHFEAIRDDRDICAAVLTGFGVKAFVPGADVGFLAQIDSPEKGFETCESCKAVGALIEQLGKPVICALNGFAFGGGLELAMCCTARICREGLKVAAGQPEVNLGLIPGAGGTQRLPRLIGVEAAAAMLRTGRPISGREAVELGLFEREVSGDLVETAVLLAREAVAGTARFEPIPRDPLEVPDELPPVDLGHLSTAIDRILCRAIIEGCRMPLEEGLRFESEMFAECCRTEDMKIGVENFLKNGPREKAQFRNA